MAKLVISWADVGGEPGVLPARRAVERGSVQKRGAGEAVEVEPRVKLARAADPFGAEGNKVFAASHHVAVADERGFTVIAHVFGGARGDEAEHFIAGLVGIVNDVAVMIANDAPLVGADGEVAVLN